MEELVAIAKVVRPRGLKGEVVAEVLTDFPERFDGLESVIGVLPDDKRVDLKIKDFWFQRERVILLFAGYESVETAEQLRGIEICIPESEATELGDDEYFDWQLESCEVVTVEGERVGSVQRLMRTGGTEILVVENNGKEYLIPFAESICTEVDIEGKKILIDPPEGLLDL